MNFTQTPWCNILIIYYRFGLVSYNIITLKGAFRLHLSFHLTYLNLHFLTLFKPTRPLNPILTYNVCLKAFKRGPFPVTTTHPGKYRIISTSLNPVDFP